MGTIYLTIKLITVIVDNSMKCFSGTTCEVIRAKISMFLFHAVKVLWPRQYLLMVLRKCN